MGKSLIKYQGYNKKVIKQFSEMEKSLKRMRILIERYKNLPYTPIRQGR